jgi:hypothetical protein
LRAPKRIPETDLIDRLGALAKRKGGRRTGATVSAEANRLIRTAMDLDEVKAQDAIVAPLFQEILETRLAQIDRQLASMIAKTGVDAATRMLICPRLLTGDSVPHEELEHVYESIRHMAIDHFKAKGVGLPPVSDAAAPR